MADQPLQDALNRLRQTLRQSFDSTPMPSSSTPSTAPFHQHSRLPTQPLQRSKWNHFIQTPSPRHELPPQPSKHQRSMHLQKLIHRYAQLQTHLLVMNKQLSDITRSIQKALSDKDQSRRDLVSLEHRLRDKDTEMESLRTIHANLRAQNESLHRQLVDGQQELTAARDQLKDSIGRFQSDLEAVVSRKDHSINEFRSRLHELEQSKEEYRKRLEMKQEEDRKVENSMADLMSSLHSNEVQLEQLQRDKVRDQETIDDLKNRLINALNDGKDAEKMVSNAAALQRENLDLAERERQLQRQVEMLETKVLELHKLNYELKEDKCQLERKAEQMTKRTATCSIAVQTQFDTMKMDLMKAQLVERMKELEESKRQLTFLSQQLQLEREQNSSNGRLKQQEIDIVKKEVERLQTDLERERSKKDNEIKTMSELRSKLLEKDMEVNRLEATVAKLNEDIARQKQRFEKSQSKQKPMGKEATMPFIRAKPLQMPTKADVPADSILEATNSTSMNVIKTQPVHPSIAKEFIDHTAVSESTQDLTLDDMGPAGSDITASGAWLTGDTTLKLLDHRIQALQDAFIDIVPLIKQSSSDPVRPPPFPSTSNNLLQAASYRGSVSHPSCNQTQTQLLRDDRTIQILDHRIDALHQAMNTSVRMGRSNKLPDPIESSLSSSTESILALDPLDDQDVMKLLT